jgi:hypothetical protein
MHFTSILSKKGAKWHQNHSKKAEMAPKAVKMAEKGHKPGEIGRQIVIPNTGVVVAAWENEKNGGKNITNTLKLIRLSVFYIFYI